jgi:propionate CoA-transferase
MYITERAVFKLTRAGLELIEIAPGVDLEKDVLQQMEFKPLISADLKLMDARIFRPEAMGLAKA